MKKLFAVTLGILIGLSIGISFFQYVTPAGSVLPSLGGFSPPFFPHMLPRAEPGVIRGALVTAYDPYDAICVGKYAFVPGSRKTATGADAEVPGIAADFDVFPPGTRIALPGIGTLTVDDTGEAMREDAQKGIYHIDLRMPADYGRFADKEEAKKMAHERAMEFGAPTMDIYVEPPGDR